LNSFVASVSRATTTMASKAVKWPANLDAAIEIDKKS